MNRMKKVFVNGSGEIRRGWLLAIAAFMYAAVIGVYYLYWYGYGMMMEIWGVNSGNISRAPGAVQFLYSWSNVIVQLIQGALLTAAAVGLSRLAGLKGRGLEGAVIKRAGIGMGIGAVCIIVIWCILMLTGSVRQGWRMSRPAFSINTFALILTTGAAAIGEGAFLYGSVYGLLKKRLPVWAALAGIAVLNALMSGTILPAALINSALLALVCCLLLDKCGLAAVIGFRAAWGYLTQAVFGFAGATAALYETYPVNMYWLNGGNAGIMNGAITAIALLAIACRLLKGRVDVRIPVRMKKRSKSPS